MVTWRLLLYPTFWVFPPWGNLFGQVHIYDGTTAEFQCESKGMLACGQEEPEVEPLTLWFVDSCSANCPQLPLKTLWHVAVAERSQFLKGSFRIWNLMLVMINWCQNTQCIAAGCTWGCIAAHRSKCLTDPCPVQHYHCCCHAAQWIWDW